MVAQPQMDTLPEWKQRLADRGILEAALECGWQYYEWYGTGGWSYPLKTFNGQNFLLPDKRISQRWKAIDRANATQAYAWGYPDQKKDDIRRPENCNYYWAKGVKEALVDSWGWLYITAGEPDMLSMIAAGIRNVTTFFGEGNIPETLAADLKRIEVSGVMYLADMDNAGIDAARKIVRALDGVIQCDVKRLPVKDVNDLWIECGFDKAKFMQTIADLPMWTFAPETLQDNDPKEVECKPYYDYDAFAQAVESELRLTGEKRNGWSKPIPCIFGSHQHDDKNPSAGWHFKTHTFKCFKCGETWGMEAVAKQLNVDIERFNLNAGKVRFFDGNYKEDAGKQAQKPAAAPVEMFISSDKSLERYRERLDGLHIDTITAAPFPFTLLHPFGGFCEILKPRKMVGVIGLSGGGKTSFLESLIDILRQAGEFHTLWWGKEWSWQEMADRAVQRMGGLTMTQVARYEMYLSEMNTKGIPKYGKPLLQDEIEKSKQLARDIQAWKGKSFYIDKSTDLQTTLDQAQVFFDAKKLEGIRLRVAVWDYASLWDVKGARGDNETIGRGLQMVKDFGEANDLFTFVASQPRKDDAARVKDGDKVLTAEDAMYMNDHKFNLLITLNPTYQENVMLDWGVINVVKNSGGKLGKVAVQMDLKRLRWLDKKPSDGWEPQ